VKKGIIMEQHPQYTIVMTDDGLFQKALPIENAQIGCEVVYRPLIKREAPSFFFKIKRFVTVPTAVLAMMCFIVLLGLPMYLSTGSSKTYAYINVDINPSVEMKLNNKMQVTSLSPLNDDASTLLDHLSDCKGKDLETVLKKVIKESEANGLTQNGKNMIIGVSYIDGQNEDLFDFDDLNLTPDWGVVTLNIPEDVREIAEKDHTSMNEVFFETVNENPDNIKHLNQKDKEIIYSFYRHKHPKENTQDSLKPKEKKIKEDQKAIEENQPSDKHKEKSAPNQQDAKKDNNSKDKQKTSEDKNSKQSPENKKKEEKHHKKHQKNKQGQHQPSRHQKKQDKQKHHQPPGHQKKQDKQKHHQPPGHQKKQDKQKHHQPPGQKKKQDKQKHHQPPGQQKHNKHKHHQPPGQQKKHTSPGHSKR